MSAKDLLQIKVDLGLCVDILMAMFIYFCISNKLGIIYFISSLIVEAICYACDLKKYERMSNNEK